MKIKTTLSITSNRKVMLYYAASKSGLTISETVIRAIKTFIERNITTQPPTGRIKYQKNDSKTSMEIIHVSLIQRDYEIFIDSRRFLKHSVSSLLSEAINQFFSKILKPINDDSDNYLFNNYILINETIHNVICWRIYWGYPFNFEKLIL